VKDTGPVRPDERFDVAALERYLEGKLPATGGPLEVEQFPGGHSNLTYLLRYPAAEYVMRRPPLGPLAPKAHDMGREHRVLKALWPVFPPAPRPFVYCDDPAVIGAPFYVMERRRGLVIRREEPTEWGADPSLRRRASLALIDTLVDFHAVDWKAIGLESLGRPDGFVARQVTGWAERWERAKDREVPAITDVARWLAERLPAPVDATLVHNDWKLDNLMLDPADPGRVVAVFDWEMCTLGDPLVDLGTLLCYWAEEGDPYARQGPVVQVTSLPGWMTRAELVERYAARSGRDVSTIAWYETFALYKTAVVVQQLYIRWKRGQTKDERLGAMAPRVEALALAAAELAEKSGL
jgi:aminoglycoside phosphotransferase (APT) family kinase protein